MTPPAPSGQRDAWRSFAACWAAAAGLDPRAGRAADRNRSLHGARFAADEATFLKWQGTARPWSLDDYGPAVAQEAESEVTVLTPRPTVEELRMRYA